MAQLIEGGVFPDIDDTLSERNGLGLHPLMNVLEIPLFAPHMWHFLPSVVVEHRGGFEGTDMYAADSCYDNTFCVKHCLL